MPLPTAAKKLAVAVRRQQVAELLANAWTQTAIAAKLGIVRRTVYADVVAITRQLVEDAKGSLEEKRAAHVARLQSLEREAREAWERSKKPKQKKSAKQVKGGGKVGKDGKVIVPPSRDETSASEEGRDGNPKFLGEARAAVMDQAKLHGLLRQDIEITGNDGRPVPITVIEIVKSPPSAGVP